MIIKKITEYGKKSYFYLGKNEIFTINWVNGIIPEFYVFDKSKKIKLVSKNYFASETIGDNFMKIEKQLSCPIEYYRATKDGEGNIYMCFFDESIIYGFNKNGEKFFEWDTYESGLNYSIYDIKHQNEDYFWLCFSSVNTVTKVSIKQKKEIFKIGNYSDNDKLGTLSFPESISITKNHLYIPSNNKIFRINLDTKETKLISNFKEKIWQYEQTPIGTYITTDSGIYEIL